MRTCLGEKFSDMEKFDASEWKNGEENDLCGADEFLIALK